MFSVIASPYFDCCLGSPFSTNKLAAGITPTTLYNLCPLFFMLHRYLNGTLISSLNSIGTLDHAQNGAVSLLCASEMMILSSVAKMRHPTTKNPLASIHACEAVHPRRRVLVCRKFVPNIHSLLEGRAPSVQSCISSRVIREMTRPFSAR
jgi:hypothetical protein